jgi:hypothetical protein
VVADLRAMQWLHDSTRRSKRQTDE